MTTFPSGVPGIGLLLLRLGLAASLIAQGSGEVRNLLIASGVGLATVGAGWLIAAAVLTGLGFLTTTTSVLTTFVELALSTQLGLNGSGATSNLHVTLLTASVAASLAFTGPGAWSIDARSVGRREITIPPR